MPQRGRRPAWERATKRKFLTSWLETGQPANGASASKDNVPLAPISISAWPLSAQTNERDFTVSEGSKEMRRSPCAEPLLRGEFFAGFLLLGYINGFATKAIQSVNRLGWSDAIWGSFDISVIVWASSFAGLSLVLQDRKDKVSNWDWVVAVGLLAAVILPIGPLSWFSVTALSVYLFISSDAQTARRGAIILFATTVPMLWSRLLFQLFARVILAADATLVSWVLGTQRTGDIVEFADGSGKLVILPSCSSLANVSLAILCWVTMSEMTSHRRSISDICWCLSACAAVVAVNVIRMSMMGISDEYYERIHGHLGEAIVNATILIITLVICSLGVKRELYASIFGDGNRAASDRLFRR